jgi:hypothetical protein
VTDTLLFVMVLGKNGLPYKQSKSSKTYGDGMESAAHDDLLLKGKCVMESISVLV